MTGLTESASHKSATQAPCLMGWNDKISNSGKKPSCCQRRNHAYHSVEHNRNMYNAPPIHTPTSPAISSPPTVISISKVSLLYKSYFSIALSITRIFLSSPLSFRLLLFLSLWPHRTLAWRLPLPRLWWCFLYPSHRLQ